MAETYTGACELCSEEAPRPQMGRHVAICAPKHDRGSQPETLVQLQIEANGDPAYWLILEGRESAALGRVDALFRTVWLECCGHLSAFRVGSAEPSMRSTLGTVLMKKGLTFAYEYDFGTTTALKGRVLGFREGSIGRRLVRLLARNLPLRWTCAECEAPATVICPYCLHSEPCMFCETHAQRHPCAEDEVFLPIVNSPRMGVCGYTG